jgi:hypothetical protein
MIHNYYLQMKNVIIPGAIGNIARHVIAYGRCDGLCAITAFLIFLLGRNLIIYQAGINAMGEEDMEMVSTL